MNCYLLEGDPLTLVDTGPCSLEALSALEAGLGSRGHRVEDLGLLLLTHQHYDHVGLARRVQERSGAEIAAHELTAGFLADLEASMDAEDDYAAAIMELHGVPPDLVRTIRDVSRAYRRFAEPVRVDRPLCEGDVVEAGGRQLTAVLHPGHSPTDTLFVDTQTRVALVGDHLIAHVSPNPVLHRPLDAPADPRRRASSLAAYLDSLRRTAALAVDTLLPGHGEPIDDPQALVAARLEMHRQRKERIYQELRSRGRATAHELARALWGDIAARQTYLTLSEALGHADLLVAEGRAREVERGGVIELEAL